MFCFLLLCVFFGEFVQGELFGATTLFNGEFVYGDEFGSGEFVLCGLLGDCTLPTPPWTLHFADASLDTALCRRLRGHCAGYNKKKLKNE